MLVIIDNLLSEDERLATIASFEKGPGKYTGDNVNSNRWIDLADVDKQDFPLRKILDVAAWNFDLSTLAGAECWAHHGFATARHVDKDEQIWTDEGKVVTPLCSIIYYAEIKNLVGGRLFTNYKHVTPKTNRLVMFTRGMSHEVERFTGTRNIIAINPWHYKIKLKKHKEE